MVTTGTPVHARCRARMTQSDEDMQSAMLALLIWDGARTADGTLPPWDNLSIRQREVLREVAWMLWPWLSRNLVTRLYADPIRLAHRIHATYTAFSIDLQGVPRHKCRSWEGGLRSQRTAMIAAARHIIGVLGDD